MRKIILLCVSVLAFGFYSAFPAGAKGVKRPVMGWISFKPVPKQAGMVSIMAKAFALRASSGRYVLTVKRKTGGGVSTSQQSGQFHMDGGQTLTLSKTAMNMPKNSVFRASLELEVGGRVVFSAVLDNNL